MICPVDRTWYFLSHNMNTHHTQIFSLTHYHDYSSPNSELSFYVDGSLKLMWVETDGWKKQVLVIQTIVPPEILIHS